MSWERLAGYASQLTPDQYAEIAAAWQHHLRELEERQNWRWRSADQPVPMSADAFSLWDEDDASPRPEMQEFNQVLRPISSALLQRFAGMLGAFAASSPDYLRRNFLHCRGEVEMGPAHLRIRLFQCPLAIVLRMAGFDHGMWEVPTAWKPTLEFRFD